MGPGIGGRRTSLAELWRVAVCQKPTLRFGLWQRMTPSVDMTADVKGGESFF